MFMLLVYLLIFVSYNNLNNFYFIIIPCLNDFRPFTNFMEESQNT